MLGQTENDAVPIAPRGKGTGILGGCLGSSCLRSRVLGAGGPTCVVHLGNVGTKSFPASLRPGRSYFQPPSLSEPAVLLPLESRGWSLALSPFDSHMRTPTWKDEDRAGLSHGVYSANWLQEAGKQGSRSVGGRSEWDELKGGI